MKETTANAPGTNAEYAAQLARKIHEPYEHVLAAVEFYGRDPIRIKRFLFEKSDDGIISLIARLLGKPAEQISFACETCWMINPTEIEMLLHQHRGCGYYI